jgi:outer membrane protein assembly factor BamB
VKWQSKKARAYVPSPVVVDDYLLVADDRGTANCFDTKSGRRVWQTRMGQGFRASLLDGNGLVYFFANDGKVSILRPGPKPDLVGTAELGESVWASAGVSQGCLFVRGEKSLFCIGKR